MVGKMCGGAMGVEQWGWGISIVWSGGWAFIRRAPAQIHDGYVDMEK